LPTQQLFGFRHRFDKVKFDIRYSYTPQLLADAALRINDKHAPRFHLFSPKFLALSTTDKISVDFSAGVAVLT